MPELPTISTDENISVAQAIEEIIYLRSVNNPEKWYPHVLERIERRLNYCTGIVVDDAIAQHKGTE